MHTTLKQLLFKLISIGLGLMVGLFLAECGVRYYWYGTNGFSYVKLNSFKTLGASGLLQRAEDDTILWELQPNLDTLFKFEKFSTNSVGMRDREYSLEKPANTKRIVVIGDSFAMGSGVSDTENYPFLLEQMFSSETGTGKVEVLNFGVGGYNLLNYEAVLRKKAMRYNPDLVIIGFCGGNDFQLPSAEHLEGKLKLRPAVEMFYRSHLRRYSRLRAQKKEQAKNQVPFPSEKEVAYMREYLQRILDQCTAGRIPVVMAYYSLIAKPEVIDFIGQFSESMGMNFINIGTSLETIPLKEKVVHPLDGHPNAMVHQVYADNIYKYLKASALLK
jgi:lysophospholipase L1-like esterase